MARKLVGLIEVAAWALFIILVARWAWSQDTDCEAWAIVCGAVGIGLELYRQSARKVAADSPGHPRRRWTLTISGLLALIALLTVIFAHVTQANQRAAIRIAVRESARRAAIQFAMDRAKRLFPDVRWQNFMVDARRVEPTGTWMVIIAPKSGARTNVYKVHLREDRITEWGAIHPAAKSKGRSPIKPLVGD
jgi:hypothetical protein